jgi:hypothetical protein
MLPPKYAKPSPINEEILRIEEAEMEVIREQNDLHKDEPLENKVRSNYSFKNINIQSVPVMESKLSAKVANLLKNFKLKAGNITVHSLFIFLKELNIK